ncbi:hypothetical protein PENSPDRAFT_648566 [Peniophora sp. CONT]|nr:hypothetical protein PENSPDRAFT_648566 [Peniophora sp. CONT]
MYSASPSGSSARLITRSSNKGVSVSSRGATTFQQNEVITAGEPTTRRFVRRSTIGDSHRSTAAIQSMACSLGREKNGGSM